MAADHPNLRPVLFTVPALTKLGEEMKEAAMKLLRPAGFATSESPEAATALWSSPEGQNIGMKGVEAGISRCVLMSDGIISICMTVDQPAEGPMFWNVSLCHQTPKGRKQLQDSHASMILSHLAGSGGWQEAARESAWTEVRQFHKQVATPE